MSGNCRDLLFWSKGRCFATKIHRWGLGPIAVSNSDTRHAMTNAQNHRWGLEPIETSISGANHAVLLCTKWQVRSGTLRDLYTGTKVAVFYPKTTREGWNPYSPFILALSTLPCVFKITDEVRDSYRLVSLVLKSLICMKRTTDEGWNPYGLVILVQITLVCMHKTTGYIWDSDTFNSRPKFAVLHPKTPHEGCDL